MNRGSHSFSKTKSNLDSGEAFDSVNALKDSVRLKELRDHYKKKFQGTRCLVLGSAPNPSVPDLNRFDTIICVNGSPWIAKSYGICCSDLTVVAGFSTLTNKPVRVLTQAIWKGMKTKEILFIETGVPLERGISILSDCEFDYNHIEPLTIYERAAIIYEVCGMHLGLGKRDDRISNGMFAVVIAMWAEAREVILTGFSLSGGHNYMASQTPREHIGGDKAFLARLKEAAVRVSTTIDSFHREFNLPIFR